MSTPPFPPSPTHWSIVSLAGHDCEVYAPPHPLPGRALIQLHDLRAGRLQDFAPLRAAIEAAHLPTLAPLTGRSWWLDRIMPAFDTRITPERFVVDTIRAEIGHRFGVAPPGIGLVGTGMGGQGALRIAYRHPATFPVAAAIAPAIDFHEGMRRADERDDGELFDTLWETFGDVERARQDTAILHVHPLNWPRHQWFASDPLDRHWHDGAARLHSKLNALGVPHEARLDDGAAFLDRMAAEAIGFVIAALDAESRRFA
jgi:hypothetical protein